MKQKIDAIDRKILDLLQARSDWPISDLAAAVQWFDDNKVTYVKRPEQGKMRDVAFIKDPDGYWIEIVQADLLKKLGV